MFKELWDDLEITPYDNECYFLDFAEGDIYLSEYSEGEVVAENRKSELESLCWYFYMKGRQSTDTNPTTPHPGTK